MNSNTDSPDIAPLDVGAASLHLNLAAITRSMCGPNFYKELARLLAELLGSDRLIVVRYTRYGAPEFIVNTAMTNEAIEFYLGDLYRVDPLYEYSRTHREGAVVTLSSLRRHDIDNPYYDAIHRTALIYDELAVLLPAPGQIFIGVCCDQSTRRFQSHEIEAVQNLYPMLDALHTAHLDQVLRLTVSGGNQPLQELPGIMMLLDRDKRLLYRSEGWQVMEEDHLELGQTSSMLDGPSGMVPLDSERSLHWQQLGDTYGVAPNGWICVVEKRSPEALGTDWNSVVEQFRERYNLTPREAEITAFVMLGFPNDLIARKLGIGHGSVKNHRHRLYQKLDITTERELFSLILHNLLAQDITTLRPTDAN